jgi:hypothetical protein
VLDPRGGGGGGGAPVDTAGKGGGGGGGGGAPNIPALTVEGRSDGVGTALFGTRHSAPSADNSHHAPGAKCAHGECRRSLCSCSCIVAEPPETGACSTMPRSSQSGGMLPEIAARDPPVDRNCAGELGHPAGRSGGRARLDGIVHRLVGLLNTERIRPEGRSDDEVEREAERSAMRGDDGRIQRRNRHRRHRESCGSRSMWRKRSASAWVWTAARRGGGPSGPRRMRGRQCCRGCVGRLVS